MTPQLKEHLWRTRYWETICKPVIIPTYQSEKKKRNEKSRNYITQDRNYQKHEYSQMCSGLCQEMSRLALIAIPVTNENEYVQRDPIRITCKLTLDKFQATTMRPYLSLTKLQALIIKKRPFWSTRRHWQMIGWKPTFINWPFCIQLRYAKYDYQSCNKLQYNYQVVINASIAWTPLRQFTNHNMSDDPTKYMFSNGSR